VLIEGREPVDGVVTLVDAVNGLATLDEHFESVKQAAVADRLVLTKTDLLDTPERRAGKDALVARLRALNPAAKILDAAKGEATPANILDCGLYDPARKSTDVSRWLAEEAYADAAAAASADAKAHDHHHDHDHHDHHDHHHAHPHHHQDVNRHDARIQAFALASDAAIGAATLELFLELLRSVHGPNLLRMKGIIRVAEMPDTPVVIHGVQHVLHPPARLPAWPDADRRTRLVFIVKDIDPKVIRELFDAFLGTVPLDGPDKAALVDNPLVPFGGIDR